MSNRFTETRETILLAAAEPAVFGPLSAELRRRGADVVAAEEIEHVADAVRTKRFDAIYVAARASADATLLLMRLIQGHAAGARLMFVVDAASASAHAAPLALAEEAMTFALSPARMADAAAVGFHREAAFA